MKKLLLGLFCGVFFVGGAICSATSGDNFTMQLMNEFYKIFMIGSGQEPRDIATKEDGEVALNTFQAVVRTSEENSNTMEEPVASVMQSLCKRMQKYIADNNLNVVFRTEGKYSELDGINFRDVDCNTNSSLLLIENLLASGELAKIKNIAYKIVNYDISRQRHGSGCGFVTGFAMEADASVEDTKIECGGNGKRCFVWQKLARDYEPKQKFYTACCVVSWTDGDDGLQNGRAIPNKYSQHLWEQNPPISLSDFDENCKPLY